MAASLRAEEFNACFASLEDIADACLHDVGKHGVDTDGVAVRCNDRALEPGAITVAKKIFAWLAREIGTGKIEAPRSVFTGSDGLGGLLRVCRAHAHQAAQGAAE